MTQMSLGSTVEQKNIDGKDKACDMLRGVLSFAQKLLTISMKSNRGGRQHE